MDKSYRRIKLVVIISLIIIAVIGVSLYTGVLQRSPERTVKKLYKATEEGTSAVKEYVHPKSNEYYFVSVNNELWSNQTLKEVNEITEKRFIDKTNYTNEDLELHSEMLESEDYAIVEVSIDFEKKDKVKTIEGYYLLFKDDGEWLVAQFVSKS